MKSVATVAVVLCGLTLNQGASATVMITPTAQNRHVLATAFASDATGPVGDSRNLNATPNLPFSATRSASATKGTAMGTGTASQNSSMSSTGVTGTGSGDATANTADPDFDSANGKGESVCDVTFTLGCDASYHLFGSATANPFHDCHSSVILYAGSGTTTPLQTFVAGLTGPGGSFDVTGNVAAGTYRIKAEAVGLASGFYGSSDTGFADFDFTLTFTMQSGSNIDPGSRPLSLLQNSPNPFRASTLIPFSLPEAGPVSLRVFDMQGRAVATLLDEAMSSGDHEFLWNEPGLPEGIYVVRLDANGERLQRKLVVGR